ncbi:hypothetical protein [Sphingomonas olei]|nr:hypothetical protein [Sphingomonas olei]
MTHAASFVSAEPGKALYFFTPFEGAGLDVVTFGPNGLLGAK